MGHHPCEVLIFVGCVHHDKIVIVSDLVNDQVIHHAALLVAHGAVSGLAVHHAGKIIGQQMI